MTNMAASTVPSPVNEKPLRACTATSRGPRQSSSSLRLSTRLEMYARRICRARVPISTRTGVCRCATLTATRSRSRSCPRMSASRRCSLCSAVASTDAVERVYEWSPRPERVAGTIRWSGDHSPSGVENKGTSAPTAQLSALYSGRTCTPDGFTTMTGTQGERCASWTGARSQWMRGLPTSTMSPSSTRGAKPFPRSPTVSIPRWMRTDTPRVEVTIAACDLSLVTTPAMGEHTVMHDASASGRSARPSPTTPLAKTGSGTSLSGRMCAAKGAWTRKLTGSRSSARRGPQSRGP